MTTDMQARDKKSFQEWIDNGGEVPDEVHHGKLFIIWRAALAAERARSKCLVEALEYIIDDTKIKAWTNEDAAKASLRAYRSNT